MKTESAEDSELIVQKLPSDMGIHRNPRKGTLNAPAKILDGFEFSRKVLVDEVFPNEFDLEETQRRIEENTRELAGYRKPIISIGGDHSVSFPVLKALKQEYPGMQLVWLDAHLDLKEPVDGHVSHDVVVRELIEREVFGEDEIWIVDITRIDDDEQEFLENHDPRVFKFNEQERFQREFNSNEQPVYLSVDIDALEGIKGTGYPDGELSIDDVKEVIETVRPNYADLVEVAPPLDRDRKTVENAREILKNLSNQLSP